MRPAQPRGVGMVRIAEDRDIRIRVRNLVRIDPRNVRDHQIRTVGAIDGDQVMALQENIQLAPEKEVDPDQQDRGHTGRITPLRCYGRSLSLERGLELIRSGEFFAAHEELETAWREAPPEERDFLQGLVHVAVAWYQAGRGNRIGCTRQLEKARRRLSGYAPVHRDVDVASVLDQLALAAAAAEAGSLQLERIEI